MAEASGAECGVAQVMSLAAVLDLPAAAPLQAALLGARGRDLVLDGAGVQRLGGPCLQVLLAARAAWQADGRDFGMRDASPAFRDAATVMGAASLLGDGAAA